MAGIACPSASSCWAVGSETTTGGAAQTLAESWNGTSWAHQATAKPPMSISASLTAVSCAAVNACTAVGGYQTATSSQTLAEVWNGTAWSVETTPDPSGSATATLTGVACTAANACTAVGYYRDQGEPVETLAEAWNGTAWSIQSTPNPAGATIAQLESVSCTATGCTAVGYYETSSFFFDVVAEQWNGSAWTIQTTPDPAAATASVLSGVSCTTATACTAAGDYSTSSGAVLTLAESWNGTSWSIQSTPNPSGPPTSALNAIACAVAACTAVGYSETDLDTTTPIDTALAEGWNGSSWSLQHAVSPSGAVGTYLNAISCPAANACTAVGIHFDPQTGYYDPLAERWNGTAWSVQTVPTPSGSTGSYLESVSCATASSCEAVGFENTSGAGVSLAEHWNGTAWSIQATPNPSGAAASLLYGVSCASASNCTAVGRYGSGGGSQTLAQTWNGTAWSIQATPNPSGSTFASLSSVSCTSGHPCQAVGTYSAGSGNKTLAEQRAGTAWSVLTTPDQPGAQSNSLASVSCPAAGACLAAGSFESHAGVTKVLAEQWNGTAWSVLTPRDPVGSEATVFYGLSCAGASACTAVGTYLPATGGTKTLAESWNGTAWSIQMTVTPAGGTSVTLQGVACVSGSACTAAGNFKNTAAEATLIETGP